MPAHFERTAGLEADGERAVLVLCDLLSRMKQERHHIGRNLRLESQGHFDRFFLIDAKRPAGELLNIKPVVELEHLVGCRNASSRPGSAR